MRPPCKGIPLQVRAYALEDTCRRPRIWPSPNSGSWVILILSVVKIAQDRPAVNLAAGLTSIPSGTTLRTHAPQARRAVAQRREKRVATDVTVNLRTCGLSAMRALLASSTNLRTTV